MAFLLLLLLCLISNAEFWLMEEFEYCAGDSDDDGDGCQEDD